MKWHISVNWLGRLSVILIGLMLLSGFLLSAPTPSADLTRAYSELAEQRNRENNAYKTFNDKRVDELDSRLARTNVALVSLEDMARDLTTLRRYIWWLFGIVSCILLFLAEVARRMIAKYLPVAWDWLMHLHKCMDLTRDTVARNAELSLEFRKRTTKDLAALRIHLHRHANYLQRLGIAPIKDTLPAPAAELLDDLVEETSDTE
jgi:hypothetical protein